MNLDTRLYADLRPGDVVEARHSAYPDVLISGALHEEGRALCLGHVLIRDGNGADVWGGTLTVVSRAPRPLYVNHPRTEPVRGDVVRQEGIGNYLFTGQMKYAGVPPYGRETGWVGLPGCHPDTGPMVGKRPLRLLVDGETGQVVP